MEPVSRSFPSDIEAAAAVLRRGGLVAFPTETVYGLGADAANRRALTRLYEVKRRPREHPVIVHIADAAALQRWADVVRDEARRLAGACWPGPLTLVVPRTDAVPEEVTGGGDSVGLRVPDQPLARELLRAFDGAIAAPSANRFGRVSPTTAQAVRDDLGTDVDMVLDGGPCRVGVESTIVDCTGDELVVLRPGGITAERLREVLGYDVPMATRASTRAPGTLPAHYAPLASVELVARGDVAARAAAHAGEGRRVGVLSPAPAPRSIAHVDAVLDSPRDVDEFASVLYTRLREADALQLDVLLVVPPAPHGVGEAVVDRLRRAAAAATRRETPVP
jgi:L-threonylcarbamoyladenylate synthase